ncbi:SIR2 family protein [Microvirga splendida]|uniref:SIR2 family protein n=1 Tax=Microvirga splendida TaxID=2795727 RepID=A0ABS0Y289_9HYPH|nr:SIR2 family protein [Microvirga splendida]MBJ6126018.1 SIR2 family protein [Microvirga splendida]
MAEKLDELNALAFSIYENRGVYALLIGSGVSRAAQIPTGWEIILDLTKRIAALEQAGEQEDWAEWYQGRFGKEPNYSDLLDALSHSQDERRAILHRYIEPTKEDLEEGRKLPTKAHRATARLVRDGFIRVIITTNFDRLLENALRDEGVEPTVIKSDDDLKGAVPLIHSRCYVIKIHGDYLDTRIRNTEAELTGYSEPMNALLDRILDEHGLIVCGWSAGWDHALRAVITRAANRRYPMFWASRGEPSVTALDLINQRAGKVIPISDADSFFEKIQRKVEIQAALQRPNPASMDLLVASAKKYLSKPEFRIQLHDLVMDEVRRLKQHMADPKLGTDGSWSPEEFKSRVALYESRSEPLIRLFAVLGRWGDGSELGLVMEILQGFGARRVLGGLTAWIYLRQYPAVLLLYAYGIGALRAGRLKAVFQWLTTKIQTENRGTQLPAVQELFLWAWDGGDNDYWNHLYDSKKKTPLSDHLHEIFARYMDDHFISKDEFTRGFERFEVLGSLAHTSTYTTIEDLKQELSSSGPGARGYVWAPLGRTGWHNQIKDVLFSELSEVNLRDQLAKAGFGKGSLEFLDLAFQSLKKGMARMSW